MNIPKVPTFAMQREGVQIDIIHSETSEVQPGSVNITKLLSHTDTLSIADGTHALLNKIPKLENPKLSKDHTNPMYTATVQDTASDAKFSNAYKRLEAFISKQPVSETPLMVGNEKRGYMKFQSSNLKAVWEGLKHIAGKAH